MSANPLREGIGDTLRRVAALTPAQRTALNQVALHADPVTAGQIADDLGIRRSSAREALEVLREQGLIDRERLPTSGRGRPSWGYVSVTPVDVEGPVRMLADSLAAVAAVLRASHPDPAGAAHAVGAAWAEGLLGSQIPDHGRHDEAAYQRLVLAEHMSKIALFSSSLGFAATVSQDRPTTLCLHACPFAREGGVDPLVCRMHLGLVERIIDATSRGRVATTLRPKVDGQVCEVELTELPGV